MPTSKPIAPAARADESRSSIVIDGDARLARVRAAPGTFVHADARRNRRRPGRCARRRAPPRARPNGRATGWRRTGPRRARWTAWLAALDEPFEGSAVPRARAALPDGADRCGPATHARPRHGRLAALDRPAPSLSARTAARTASMASSRRPWARRRGRAAGRARGRRRVVPPRPQRARRREAPRAVRDDRPGQQRWRRHLLVPAPGARPMPGAGLPDRYEELFGTPARDRRRADRDGARAASTRWSGRRDLGAQVERSIGRPACRCSSCAPIAPGTSPSTARSPRSSRRRSGRERAWMSTASAGRSAAAARAGRCC